MATRWFASLLLVVLCCSCHPLRQCDLLFHVAEQDNQITSVTPGMIDHVAICLGPDSVIEAIERGVVITPLDTVLNRESGYYLVARTKGPLDLRRSLSLARTYLGRRYDHLYLPDNEEIYCSELVLLSFVYQDGRPVFAPVPMSFHDGTGRITDYWQQFYAKQGMEVPEGQPGSNPGELSQRETLKIVRKLKDKRH